MTVPNILTRRNIVVAAVVAVCCFGVACLWGLPAGAAASTNPNRVSGRVTDACTGKPIGGASITLVPTAGEGNPPLGDKTTSKGGYVLNHLTAGDYTLHVSAPGYTPIGDNKIGPAAPTVHIDAAIGISNFTQHFVISFSLFPPGPC